MPAACAVEAMGADLALRKTDSVDKILQSVKLKRCQAELLAKDLNHAVVFRAVGFGILLKVLVGIPFKILYDSASDEFEVALGCCEVDKRTAIDKRRTSYADMHLLRSIIIKHSGVVAKLSAAHDRIVAEQDTVILKHRRIGDELHLCHQLAHILARGSEAAGPGRSVLRDSSLIRHLLAVCITERHSYT